MGQGGPVGDSAHAGGRRREGRMPGLVGWRPCFCRATRTRGIDSRRRPRHACPSAGARSVGAPPISLPDGTFFLGFRRCHECHRGAGARAFGREGSGRRSHGVPHPRRPRRQLARRRGTRPRRGLSPASAGRSAAAIARARRSRWPTRSRTRSDPSGSARRGSRDAEQGRRGGRTPRPTRWRPPTCSFRCWPMCRGTSSSRNTERGSPPICCSSCLGYGRSRSRPWRRPSLR